MRREGREELGLGLVPLGIGGQPAYSVIVADHDLEAAPAIIDRGDELGAPLRRHPVAAEVAERMELAAGDVRGRVGRQRLGVDGDREAGLLHEPRGGETHDAGAEHRDRALMALQAELDGELRRSPGEGDAGAAMAVIVDQPLVAQRLGADDEAGGAIGAQARDGADYPVGRDQHARQAACRRRRRAPRRHGGRAARQDERGGGGAEKGAAMHKAKG